MKITKIKWAKNQDVDAWTALRMSMEGIGQEYTRVGGSDIGNALFSSKWKCPRRLAKHLVGEQSYFEITDATLDGILQEPLIASMWESWDEDDTKAKYQASRGIKVRRLKKAKFFLMNSDVPNIFVSLDFIPFDSNQYSPFTGIKYHPLTPHEVKLTNKDYYRHWNYKGYPITEAYYSQVQAQMAVTGTDVAVFIVKVKDTGKLYVNEIPRDDEFIQFMKDKIASFVETVNICKVAYYRYLLFQGSEEEKANLRDIYENLLPPFGNTEDDEALADEEFEPSIDADANFIKANEEQEQMMSDYQNYKDIEKTVKEHMVGIRANLKHQASGFDGILSDNFKAIIRGQRSDKGSYFKINKLNK